MDERYQMLSDYIDELQSIIGVPTKTEGEKKAFFQEVTDSDCTRWIDIRAGEKRIGFLIVGTAPNCHPDADYYIEEAYICPEFRRNQHMCAAVSDFLMTHKGVYCLFVLNNNTAAKCFWENAFERNGYNPCFLMDVGAGDEFCTQYGFRPKQAAF